MSDQFTPESIANEALDAAGIDYVIGNLGEGTREAQRVLRKYTTCMRQLLRCAHWAFARKQAVLQLVADASGNMPNVGRLVPGPFTYSYSMPTDCLKVRYIPANYFANQTPPIPVDNIVPASNTSPLFTANGQPPWYSQRIIPTRFLVGTDNNNIPDGASNDIAGVSPIGMTVIMSNQPQARCVYTFDANYPNLWDELFRSAMVAFLASEVALPLSSDKKTGMVMRDRNIAIAKDKIREARATSSNEAGWNSSDLQVDWMQFRMSGAFSSGYGWGGSGGLGMLMGGFDGVWLGDNSAAY